VPGASKKIFSTDAVAHCLALDNAGSRVPFVAFAANCRHKQASNGWRLNWKGDDYVEEADAHPNPGHDHEWVRRADLEEFRGYRFDCGLRCRRRPGWQFSGRRRRRRLRRAIAGNWNKKEPLAAIAGGPIF